MSHILDNAVNKSSTFNNDKEINKAINQHPRLVKIKKRAKILKKEEQYKDTPLSSLLDIASQELGFKHWHEAYTNIKNLYYPKTYQLNDFYCFGLSQPAGMKNGIHIGYSSKLNMNLWNNYQILREHTTIFGVQEERQKLHSYLLKQSLKNDCSLTLIDNTSLINELEEYINEEDTGHTVYKLNFISHEEYLHSPYKDKIEKTTASLLNSYIEYHFLDIFNEQEFIDYSEKERNQIKLLGNICFSYFNLKKEIGKNIYSCSDYYNALRKSLDWDYLIKECKHEPFIHRYINENGFQGTVPCHWISEYFNTLESFNLANINKNTIDEHNKIKNAFLGFVDYWENNLYCYFDDNIIDINRPKFKTNYIFNISISESLLNYTNPNIAHLMVTMLYKHADLFNLFRGIDTEVLKKDIKPLSNKSVVFIKDCPLTKSIDKFLTISTANNSALIFSYEYAHEDYIDKYRAAFCSAQFLSCESKRSIMENNPDEQKIQEKYHDENVYLRYENYNCKDENNNPIEHYITLSLQKFSEKKLLKMKDKKKK